MRDTVTKWEQKLASVSSDMLHLRALRTDVLKEVEVETTGPSTSHLQELVAIVNLDLYGKVHIAKVGPSKLIEPAHRKTWCAWRFANSNLVETPANFQFKGKTLPKVLGTFHGTPVTQSGTLGTACGHKGVVTRRL